MEVVNPGFWHGKRVFITGHTGFKGAWLSLWLHQLGAEVHGLALDPPTDPSLYDIARVSHIISSDTRADIRDYARVLSTMRKATPDVIFHLAAQPLVGYSFQQPLETYAVNVMGTAHLLEAARSVESVQSIVVITTDKCYENRKAHYAYRESDRLGGHDPYSNSKACAELVVSAYRDSFLGSAERGDKPIALATARAGNVFGGGDWAANRLLPDCIRSFLGKRPVQLRYPDAIRPWQHVLEPLSGYLMLAEKLLGPSASQFAEAWNFGPDAADTASVGSVASRAAVLWGLEGDFGKVAPQNPEAEFLSLDSTKARNRLEWEPRWSLSRGLEETIGWYRSWSQGGDMLEFTLEQIRIFSSEVKI